MKRTIISAVAFTGLAAVLWLFWFAVSSLMWMAYYAGLPM